MARGQVTTFVLLLVVVLASADRVHELFFESFDSASGVQPPEGWLNVDLLKTFYYSAGVEDLWRFDNPGGQELIAPLSWPAAIFDSDATSAANNLPENVALVTRSFDTSHVRWDSSAVLVDWDQHFVEGYDAKVFVEVWDGHKWVEVWSTVSSTPNPDHQIHDLSPILRNSGHGVYDARLRFRWTGDGSWFWLVDNVRVAIVDTVFTANGCPSHMPHKCRDGSCVAETTWCLLDNHCPRSRPHRCLDGVCVHAEEECSPLLGCSFHEPLRCADGSCVASEIECATAGNCPLLRPVRCRDGSCVADATDCPTFMSCRDHLVPHPCLDGTCAPNADICPDVKASKLLCPRGHVQCLDLSCAPDHAQCGCPLHLPFLCAESRECVADSCDCKSSTSPQANNLLEPQPGHVAFRLRSLEVCPEGTFRCADGACVRSLSECACVLCSVVANERGEVLPYKCPDGSCAAERAQCPPIASCPTGWQRCADGSCAKDADECPASELCTYGRKRCPDGRCYDVCPPFFGCPMDTPVLCPNHQCAANIAQCFQGCLPWEHHCNAEDGDQCRSFQDPCPAPPSRHRAVPFDGLLRGIARQQSALGGYHDVVYVADRAQDEELFATISLPKGIFGRMDAEARVIVRDVPPSEYELLEHFEAISAVLSVSLPAEVFAEGDMVRITLLVDRIDGTSVENYCLAQLTPVGMGRSEWLCVDGDLIADGEHYSGLVNNTDGPFVVMHKPPVCHNYRGFDDDTLELVMLGRVVPKTVAKLQAAYDKLSALKARMHDIKKSKVLLNHIAQQTFVFAEQCIDPRFNQELSTFPDQLGPDMDMEEPMPPKPCPGSKQQQ